MLAWAAYLTVAVVWGSTFVAIAWAIESFTPFGLSAARFLPAGILALLVGRWRREALPRPGDLPRLALVGILLLTVCMALIAWAETRVSSGVAATMAATVPMFLALLEPSGMDGRRWSGLGLGFLGVALLMWPSGASPDLLGCLVLAGSALLWSLGTLCGRRDTSTAGHFSKVGVEMLTAGLLSLLLVPFTGGFTHSVPGPRSLAALAYLVLFGSIAAYSAYIHLTRVWDPAKAGTYAFWNPVVAILLGWSLRGEAFSAGMGTGLALILGGVGLVQLPLRRTVVPEEEPG